VAGGKKKCKESQLSSYLKRGLKRATWNQDWDDGARINFNGANEDWEELSLDTKVTFEVDIGDTPCEKADQQRGTFQKMSMDTTPLA